MPGNRVRTALDRITRKSDLARMVPRLEPEALHAVIERRGLQDCGDLLAMMTPAQFSAVLDLDLWNAAAPGGAEQFDGARFGEWVAALVDAGPVRAAEWLAQMDSDLVIAGIASSIRVFDPAVFAPAVETSGADPLAHFGAEHGTTAEIGGYIVVARRPESWDAIIDALLALEEHHADVFHRVMRACRTLSNAGREADGLDSLLSAADQAHFELSVSREARRERLGYVSPEHARAFLAAARQPSVPAFDERTRPAARSRALIHRNEAAIEPRLFLANVLMSGCSVQGRSFTRTEALDAVEATCALGAACWPENAASSPPEPVVAFQTGWSVLHRDVSMPTAARLHDVLEGTESHDQRTQFELRLLRRDLQKARSAGAPWRARGRLDVLASLDLPAWAALTALLDECPVMLANVRGAGQPPIHAVDPSDFQFISMVPHIEAVHRFLASLEALLS